MLVSEKGTNSLSLIQYYTRRPTIRVVVCVKPSRMPPGDLVESSNKYIIRCDGVKEPHPTEYSTDQRNMCKCHQTEKSPIHYII